MNLNKGRPKSTQLHDLFLHLLFGKISTIQAEIKFIISLRNYNLYVNQICFNTNSKNRQNKKLLSLLATQQDLEQIKFSQFSPQLNTKLITQFQKIISQQSFHQISSSTHSNKIFGNSYDLSNILLKMRPTHSLNQHKFSAEQLFFIGLLFIKQKNLLFKKTLSTIMDSIEYILQGLQFGLTRIGQNISLNNEGTMMIQRLGQSEQLERSVNSLQGYYKDSICIQERQGFDEEQQIKQWKKIGNKIKKDKKIRKDGKKRIRKIDNQEVKIMKNKFYVDFSNYICHSYLYILKDEQKEQKVPFLPKLTLQQTINQQNLSEKSQFRNKREHREYREYKN